MDYFCTILRCRGGKMRENAAYLQLLAPQLQVCGNTTPASAAPLYNNAAHGDADAAHLNFYRELGEKGDAEVVGQDGEGQRGQRRRAER